MRVAVCSQDTNMRFLVKTWVITKFRSTLSKVEARVRHLSGRNEVASQIDVERIRNIGIAAHIDAGKTTTTERMLFFSGVIRSTGEVHNGDTVMDFMDQERARGITIASASIAIPWMGYRLNLIDTPGHVDFTVEVEKSLRVMDGAVAVLDASAGVEAQTVTVWRQADRYRVPRIAYLNKMDKTGAALEPCLRQMERQLRCVALAVHQPVGQGRDFCGVVDLVEMTLKEWRSSGQHHSGKVYTTRPLNRQVDGELVERCTKLQARLVDRLADLDDQLAELVLERESLQLVTADEIRAALRRVTLSGKGVPVLCGSSYRNVGVQPLMDAVVAYLPSPSERRHEFVEAYRADGHLCALAFKIQNDAQRGLLTFLRLYCGRIEAGQKVFNVSKQKTEKVSRLYVASADELTEEASMSEGNIAVVSGLKECVTGDTLTSSASAARAARCWLAARQGVAEADVAPVLAGVQVPDPVFFCSIEPSSLMHEKPLEQALELLQKEDPGLQVSADAETGQTVIAGMGELHLEITLERIRSDFGVDARLGPFQVAYKETLTEPVADTYVLDRNLAGSRHYVKLGLTLRPDAIDGGEASPALRLSTEREARERLAAAHPLHLKAVQRGVASALSMGPLLSYPVIRVGATLDSLEVGARTSEAMVTAAAAQGAAQLLRRGGVRLLEPVMRLQVAVDEGHLHAVLADLARHRSTVLEIAQRQELKVVSAECPLAELRGYSTRIRILTSGTATFTMEFARHKVMTTQEQQDAIRQVTGLPP